MKMAFNQSQMAGPFDTDSMINLRVLAAGTGVCYNVTLHPSELRSVFIGCKPFDCLASVANALVFCMLCYPDKVYQVFEADWLQHFRLTTKFFFLAHHTKFQRILYLEQTKQYQHYVLETKKMITSGKHMIHHTTKKSSVF
jgi:hypothetical protein